MSQATLRLERAGPIARVVLSRPEIRNAFDDLMIAELHEAFRELRDDEGVRVVVLTGEGNSFCAGADLHWMKRVIEYSREESYKDSLRLAEMLEAIYDCPKPVIGRINGPAVGGGTGLVAVCDIAIGSDEAWFAFSETRLGLVPAVISPYLMKRMGESRLREFFLTGRRFSAAAAVEMGLLNSAAPPDQQDARVDETVKHLVAGGPHALAKSKKLLSDISGGDLAIHQNYTAKLITELRLSEEGQQGMSAFLEKRKPPWLDEQD